MSKHLSRRQFLKIASMTTLGGILAGCSTPTPESQPEAVETTAPGAAEAPEATTAPEPASGETVVLDYYIVGNADTDQRPLVEKAINEYIEPLIGANVVFHIVGWADWASKAITGLRAGEKMDVFFTADWFNYMELASEGLFRALNDDNGEYGNLFEQYGQGILKNITPAFIPGTQIDGINYAVPTNKELTVPEGFLYNLTLAEEIGLTPEEAAKIKSYQDMGPWLEKAKAARPDEYPYNTDGRDGFYPWLQELASGVPGAVINMKIAPDASGNFDETITSIWETDWAQAYSATMRDWYQKGYIHPDSGLTTFDVNPAFNAGKFLFYPMPLKGSNIKAQEMVNASGNADLKVGEVYGQPKVNITVHAGGSMLAIPTVSEYPMQAMKYINLMHTDSKLVNMMLFGVEGTHWEFEADGRVNLINSAWYGAHPGAWTMGNILVQAVTNKEDPTKNKLLLDYSKDAVDHPTLGFRFRRDPVAAEFTALQTVVDGTDRALRTGYVDPAVELPKYVEAMKAAGLETIQAEVQKQYDAWKETKS